MVRANENPIKTFGIKSKFWKFIFVRSKSLLCVNFLRVLKKLRDRKTGRYKI